jgi:phosphoglycerate dehydrogenase-like enzyme
MWELQGRTMLVVGLGGIGTQVAKRAHGLGMRVIATRNSSRKGPNYVDYVGLSDELHKLAAEADVVVNSTPLTPATTGMFDKKFFAAMKPGSYFINVGRGKSVVTADLVEALNSGSIGGAGLDVQDPEPLPMDHPLWTARNVVITPHISASSDEQMKRFWLLVRENLRRYVNGEKMLNVVDIKRGY